MNINSRRGFLLGMALLVIGIAIATQPAQAASPNASSGSHFEPLAAPMRSPFAQPDPQQMRWASQALAQLQSVHIGMTRAQMAGVLERAGGAYAARATAPLTGVYSLRSCPYFKVDVEFQPVRKPQRDQYGSVWTPEDPKDVITKISKPYLEQVYYD